MSDKDLLFDEKLASFYDQMGYAEVEMYNEPDYDLMNYDGHSKYATKFNLKESDIDAIILAIKQSAAYQRANQKSMTTNLSTSAHEPDSHNEDGGDRNTEVLLQTRQAHMDEVAMLAHLISKGIGVNSGFASAIGLGHDLGHDPFGHYGERVFDSIGRLRNCTYMGHAAMGAYISEREHIVEDAEEAVMDLNIKADREEVRRFMRYVIDGIVSHNGEGTVGKIIPHNKTAQDMIEEIRKCFTEKGYDKKIMPATIEGAIIRYADILAYTRSDLVDGFRMRDENDDKVLEEFNDDYLALIGTVIAKKNNYNRLLTLDNKFLLELYGLSKRIKELEKKATTPEDFLELHRSKKERELIQKKYNEFCKLKIQYAKEYISILKPSEVKTKIPKIMQTVFLKDLIETSRDKNYITMSPLMRRTFFGLRDLNFKYVVPFSRRRYLKDIPVPTNDLIEIFADDLIKVGIVYDCIPEEERQKYGIPEREGYSKKMDAIVKQAKVNFEVKMFHYYDKLPKDKKYEIYENSIRALKDITLHDIKIALGEEDYEGELKQIYEMQKIIPIRRKISELGEVARTEEGQKRLFDDLVKERLKGIEKMVASKLAIEYVGGMTDNTLESLLISRGLISQQHINENYGRPPKGKGIIETGVKRLQVEYNSALDETIMPDNIPEEDIRL